VNPGRRVLVAARGLVRDPAGTWRQVAGQKLKAFVRLLAALPGPLRRAVGRALGLAGRRDPVLALVGAAAAGRGPAGVAEAERLGTSGSVDPRTALRLARALLALDAVAAAQHVAESLVGRGAAGTAGALALRADIALRTGRYGLASQLASESLAARPSATARAIRDRAAGELRVLEPGWRPVLPAPTPRTMAYAATRGRILHLLTNSLPYRQAGYTVRAQSIGRSQADAGLDPHFATRAGFPLNEGVLRVAREERVDGIPYHRLAPGLDPSAGPERIATETAREAAGLVARLRPAALHPASNFLNGAVALALRDRFGIPVVYEVRGFLEETWASRQAAGAAGAAGNPPEAERYSGAKAAETAVMLAADAVVTLSETMRVDIVGRGAKPADVLVIPNAVDVDRFVSRGRDDALAAALGIQAGETVIGYVSSLTGYEGIRYLLQATAILRDRGRRVRALIVGDGEDRPALEAESRRLGLGPGADGAGTAIFTGRVNHADVQRYYSVIDVFVVPRTNDRVSRLVTPLKPYEAMALERAVVVSGVDALREIVADGETGLVFRPEDATSLADVVEPLLDDTSRRQALGRAARAWVAENRTWSRNGRRYRELYERLGAV
jgi:glycosyltransferase involved in cell wall biosynthesis